MRLFEKMWFETQFAGFHWSRSCLTGWSAGGGEDGVKEEGGGGGSVFSSWIDGKINEIIVRKREKHLLKLHYLNMICLKRPLAPRHVWLWLAGVLLLTWFSDPSLYNCELFGIHAAWEEVWVLWDEFSDKAELRTIWKSLRKYSAGTFQF